MTTYRLFPSTSGPSNAVSYSGDFISGACFTPKQGGCWFEGYWWWVAPGSGGSPVPGGTSPVKCALWSIISGSTGKLVSGSVVTSGTLTAGWNYIPLSAPVQLSNGYDPASSAHGSAYVAAIGVNGNFPDTASQFNSGDTYSAGITDGPLFAYSGTTGSKPAPYGFHQGVFSVGGTDPSVTLPTTADSGGDGASNFWVDVQIADTAPAGYGGSYRLWPNKADANSSTTNDSELNYTIATEIVVSQQLALNNIWYYSPSGSTELATRCDVWSIATGLSVASITSPSWSGSAGTGWLSAAFAGGTTLAPGDYRVSVYCANGTSGFWGAKDASTGYWASGAGSAGITWGPLHAPPLSAASDCWEYNASDSGATPPYSNGTQEPGQAPFGQLPGGGVTFPELYADGLAQWYLVDLEGTPEPSSQAALTVTPSFAATAVRGRYRGAALMVAPVFAAVRAHGRYRAAALVVVPSLAAGRAAARSRHAALIVTPSFRALATGSGQPPAPTPVSGIPATGAWWALVNVFQQREEEFDTWESIVESSGGMACPVCGEPLVTGPPSAEGTVAAYCRFAGDHEYHVPRDVVPLRRGVKMGRFG